MTQKVLKVKNSEPSKSCNDFLKEILNSKKVSALLVQQEVPSKKISFAVLITDPEKMNSDIFSPVLPSSTATIVSRLTKFEPPKEPIGVVMRPCQIIALIELVKLNQANLDNIIIIGVDCLGTFSINKYTDFSEKKTPTNYLIDSFSKKTKDADKFIRSACLICKDPIPANADLTIGVYGTDPTKEIIIEASSDNGKKLIEDLKLDSVKDVKTREKAIETIRKEKTKKREDFIKSKESTKGIVALSEFFDKCINCHNCMKACPICYCKECLFESSVFDAEAYKYLKKATNKGLFKMPTDSILFHLGRMNHMVLSCVECGLCEQACPSNIPLMDIIISIAENAQKEFKYNPGKDQKEKIPMIVYREDEYLEVGEA
jgi:formate dehydrogenase subunit beta